VQATVKDAVIRSPFVWQDEVVRKEEKSIVEEREARRAASERQNNNSGIHNDKDDDDDDDDGGGRDGGRDDRDDGLGHPDDIGFQSWVQERKWTSDRVRRIIQRHSRRLLSVVLNISSWRQIAIAIARRYLNGV
jgi:hypothetical protein